MPCVNHLCIGRWIKFRCIVYCCCWLTSLDMLHCFDLGGASFYLDLPWSIWHVFCYINYASIVVIVYCCLWWFCICLKKQVFNLSYILVYNLVFIYTSFLIKLLFGTYSSENELSKSYSKNLSFLFSKGFLFCFLFLFLILNVR